MAERRFHHTARHTKNHTGAGTNGKWHIGRTRLNLVKLDTEFLDHENQLFCRNDMIDIRHIVTLELITRRLILLRHTRHHGNGYRLEARFLIRRLIVLLEHRAEHFHWRFAGRYIGKDFRMFRFHKTHPRRTARRKQRHGISERIFLFPILKFIYKLRRLFNDS